MKIKVQTKSGEFEYNCEPGELLLYAGLRHGLTLPYECATGTCGTCRARVKDGEINLEWADAPGLSYVNQEKNELLMCRSTAPGDCTLRVPAEVSEGMGTKTVPGYRKGEIKNVRELTHDVVSFDVDIDSPMSFDAGQFAVLDAVGVTGGRAYSMVNYATSADTLNFVVKRKPEGKFSDWLFDNNIAGHKINVFGPLGKATFHPEEKKNILCMAGGSGIAGMMSIIARGCDDSHFADHKGHVFFGVRTAQDIFYLEEFSSFVEAYPKTLEVTIALSDEDVTPELKNRFPMIKFQTGFVHTVTSEQMAGKYENILAYVAGPPPMVDGALRMLVLEARLPGTDIRYDKFG
ncbi:MAG: 2Fe-2S iron-sulfur cluster binding domain-containing protein [Rhodospirillales bacterium]|nr:2Fe-2S iron-sulfur cluster binding domain-containing protein [Rhodospirillales bacterium]